MNIEEFKAAAAKAGMAKFYLKAETAPRDDMFVVGVDFVERLHAEMAALQPLADSFVAPGVTVDTPEWRDFLAGWFSTCDKAALTARIDAHTARAVAAAVEELRAQKAGTETMFYRMKAERDAALNAQPVAGELPPLPKYYGMIDVYHDDGRVTSMEGWTSDQMRGYAIDYGMQLGRAALQPVQQPAAVAGQERWASAINALLSVATAAYYAMDNSEERANASGGEDAEYIIQGNDFTALSAAMDEIDALPDDRPGYTLSGGARASWALRDLFTTPVPAPAAAVIGQEAIGTLARNSAHELVFTPLHDFHVTDGMQLFTAPVPDAGAQGDAAASLLAESREEVCRLKAKLVIAQQAAAVQPDASGVQGDDDWTMDDVELAGKIMLLLGRAPSCSREPGSDSLRDRIAAMLNKHHEATTMPDSGRDAALKSLRKFSPYIRGREGQEHASMTTDALGLYVLLSDVETTLAAHPAPSSDAAKCEICQGNDGDMPCAYPSENMVKCIRRIRRTAESLAAHPSNGAQAVDALNTIVPDWPFCNPGCDYEDPHGGMHDGRSKSCMCEAAKASIARQSAAPQKKEG